MGLEKALIVLGATPEQKSDAEALAELLEEAVFEIANYFMMRPFIPQLSRLKRKKLRDLQAAVEVLNLLPGQAIESSVVEDTTSEEFRNPDCNGPQALQAIVKNYHAQESKVKRALVQSTDPRSVSSTLLCWEEIYLHFAKVFCQCFEKHYPLVTPNSNARLSEHFDHNVLAEALQNRDSSDGALHAFYSRLRKVLDSVA
jgi:hypothetical protein